MCKTLGMEMNTFFRRKPMMKGDIFLSDNTKKLHMSEVSGPQGNVLKVFENPRFQYRRIVDLNNFKLKKQFDEKNRVLTIHLESPEGKTATVVHSLCNYISLELPPDSAVDPDIFYQGVRLTSLLRNRNWFFNRRLPDFSEPELVQFLKRDVDFSVVLSLSETDRARIAGYVEVREEVNEESFGVVNYGIEPSSDEDQFQGMSMAEMFRKTMTEMVEDREMASLHQNLNWADEVEQEIEEDVNFFTALDEDGTVLAARAFGYRKPKAVKSAHTISSLQQGAELRLRILDSFFRLQNVKSEPSRNLPCYHLWLESHKKDVTDPTRLNLIESLQEHMITALWESTGTKRSNIRESLQRSRGRLMEVPLQTFHSYENEDPEFMTQDDVLDFIKKQSEDYQEEISDDDEAMW
jgi:hypothetical protein